MNPIDFDTIRKSLHVLFDDLEKLSLIHSYSSEHEAALLFASWFDNNMTLFTDDLNGFGNQQIRPYEAGFILNYIRTVINKYDEEAKLSLTEAPHIQALVIKHGFAKVVKEGMYKNEGLNRILLGYKEFHDETFIYKSNDDLTGKIPSDTTPEAMMHIFANDIPVFQEDASVWLAHYLLLTPSCEKANEAVSKYNQHFYTSIPEITPKRIMEYKNSTFEKILNKVHTLSLPPVEDIMTVDDLDSIMMGTILDLPITKLDELDVEPLSTADIIARQSFENSTAANSIEDISTAYGIPIISGDEWRKLEFTRNKPILVKNFDFRHIKRQDLGRANFMLIGPRYSDDIRIEIKSQNVPGTAGDKLPVSIRRYKGWSDQKVYGQTIVSVLGNIEFFSKIALEMAREEVLDMEQKEASQISSIKYTEGQEAFNKLIQKSILDIKALYSNTLTIQNEINIENK